jgi:hypothetical protein
LAAWGKSDIVYFAKEKKNENGWHAHLFMMKYYDLTSPLFFLHHKSLCKSFPSILNAAHT